MLMLSKLEILFSVLLWKDYQFIRLYSTCVCTHNWNNIFYCLLTLLNAHYFSSFVFQGFSFWMFCGRFCIHQYNGHISLDYVEVTGRSFTPKPGIHCTSILLFSEYDALHLTYFFLLWHLEVVLRVQNACIWVDCVHFYHWCQSL